IQASILEIASSETSAAATSSLSAIGSRRVPSVVTWLRRRATTPSAQSVIAARMKMAAAISAWTRDEEIRNTMSSGTATMRMRVSPMGRFTRRLRPKRRLAALLSAPWNDLVNAREVDRDERGRVQAQARADVGAPSGGEECPGAITGREVDGPAVDALDRELDGRVAQVEPGNRLATALTRRERGVGALRRCQPPGLGGIGDRRDRDAAVGERGDHRRG